MVTVKFIGEKVNHKVTSACFGFFNNTPQEKFKNSTHLIFYPHFSNSTHDIRNVNLFLNDIFILLDPYIDYKDEDASRYGLGIWPPSVIREGIKISTKYPSPFIVGIFEIIRDAFYYPKFVETYLHTINTIMYETYHLKTVQSIKIAYYIALLQKGFGASALWTKYIRKGELNFLDNEIINPKLAKYTSIKENRLYRGVNDLFRHGEVIDIKGKELLFYRQIVPDNMDKMPKDLLNSIIKRRSSNYKYTADEIKEIISIIK